MENFEDIWNECAGKAIDFTNFEAVYPKVPQQDNGYENIYSISFFYMSYSYI